MHKCSGLELFSADTSSELSLPIADGGIKAGFPNPAQDFMDLVIDLNKELVKHPASTFYGRVTGDSMIDAGVYDGDILIIDKSLEPRDGDMAVCFVDGEFTIKYIKTEREVVWLVPANNKYEPIRITEENDFLIWGIVTYSIKKQR
ncbi:translesion error-prone DNA polymerase V autoproteolytic subunit [Massilibacteroides sp.]|uniref:LexA family protein n=1 Tax=Massilibacteroides sp. TaxID=2034766 RepID=UPI0026053115|nr:translesion error-prone DNA polymerase V autoproteolytic subunit [Massilibacteroides sp.]MDD4514220.1 translesion error-prone DNA polymerase V autoproteolytic subunit [Massilibacteroides sp.]